MGQPIRGSTFIHSVLPIWAHAISACTGADAQSIVTYRGTNYVRGSLNWGPVPWLNAVSKTFGWWFLRRGSWDQDFHTYALEWDESFM